MPPGIAAVDGEEDELRLADQVLDGDVADAALDQRHAAVGRVVAVVAHEEHVVRGDQEVGRVVVRPVLGLLEDRVAHAIGQGLQVLVALDRDAALAGHGVADKGAGHQDVVDVELACAHLDVVAGQADDALDVVHRRVAGVLEDDDVAAGGQAAEDAAGEQRRRERQREMAVAIGVFGDEQVVADQQRRDHRAAGDVERLERDGADADGDQHGVEDGLRVVDEAAGGRARHLAHRHGAGFAFAGRIMQRPMGAAGPGRPARSGG